MKNKTLFVILPIISLLILSFAEKKAYAYSDYAVYPEPKKITLKPGSSSFIAIKFELPANSHIYGNPKGPGIGKETKVFVKELSGFDFSPTQYLKAEKYVSKGEKKYSLVYKNETYLFIPFSVKTTTVNGTYTLDMAVDATLCTNNKCIPQKSTLTFTIIVDNKMNASTSHSTFLLKKFKNSQLPDKVIASNKDIDNPLIHDNKKSYFKNIKFKARHLEAGLSGILQAILYGLLAGFILNFMPCVLPVVSIKIMSFVQHAGKDRKELIALGSLFSGGILVSFLILASLAAFFGYNWGGLFQHNLFLIIMIAIVFALALSMFGVYTINIPSFAGKIASDKNNQHIDAFTKGLLATLLATPCSGPFLGGTLAWTLAQPPVTIFIIFMSVGVGMALPYFILTLNPKFLKFVPKPGNWMNTFEAMMAFFLIFTVIYLMGILPHDLLLPTLMFLGFVALAFWQLGKYGSLIQNSTKRILSSIFFIIIIIAGYFLSYNYLYKEPSTTYIESKIFSVEQLFANRENNRISIVKFTADWCPNCKLVEKISLNTPEVSALIKKHNINMLVADITRKNPPAEELLNKLGNYSIPVLAIIPPGKDFTKPLCLRDIYSKDDVMKAITLIVKESKEKSNTPAENNNELKTIKPQFEFNP